MGLTGTQIGCPVDIRFPQMLKLARARFSAAPTFDLLPDTRPFTKKKKNNWQILLISLLFI